MSDQRINLGSIRRALAAGKRGPDELFDWDLAYTLEDDLYVGGEVVLALVEAVEVARDAWSSTDGCSHINVAPGVSQPLSEWLEERFDFDTNRPRERK